MTEEFDKLKECVLQAMGVHRPEDCAGCKHKELPDGGHCYMFEEFRPDCMLYELPKRRNKS